MKLRSKKKAEGRLKERIARYERSKNEPGRRRPGSQNPKKGR